MLSSNLTYSELGQPRQKIPKVAMTRITVLRIGLLVSIVRPLVVVCFFCPRFHFSTFAFFHLCIFPPLHFSTFAFFHLCIFPPSHFSTFAFSAFSPSHFSTYPLLRH
jgi:hypothetical protein